MIKFDFTVDEEDASNIMGIMQSAVCHCDVKVLDEMAANNDPEVILFLKRHKAYLTDLQKKMKNYRHE